jgi:hypothetical protein
MSRNLTGPGRTGKGSNFIQKVRPLFDFCVDLCEADQSLQTYVQSVAIYPAIPMMRKLPAEIS